MKLIASCQVEVVGMTREDVLDNVPSFAIHDGFAVVLDGFVAIFQYSDVDLVEEELMVGGQSAEDVGEIVDLGEGELGRDDR